MVVFENHAQEHALYQQQCRRSKVWDRQWIDERQVQAEQETACPQRPGSPKWAASPRSKTVPQVAAQTSSRSVGSSHLAWHGAFPKLAAQPSIRIRHASSEPVAPVFERSNLSDMHSDGHNFGFVFPLLEHKMPGASPRPKQRIFSNVGEQVAASKDQPVRWSFTYGDSLQGPGEAFPKPSEHYGRAYRLTNVKDVYRRRGAFGAVLETDA